MNRFTDTRNGKAIYYALIAAVASVAFGFLLGSIISLLKGTTFFDSWFSCTRLAFIWFCGYFVVEALLLVLTKIKEDYAHSFSAGIYYGGLLLAGIAQSRWGLSNSDACLLGFGIAVMLALILWQSSIKPNMEREARRAEELELEQKLIAVHDAIFVRCANCDCYIGLEVDIPTLHRYFTTVTALNGGYTYKKEYTQGDAVVRLTIRRSEDFLHQFLDKVEIGVLETAPRRNLTRFDYQLAREATEAILLYQE